MQLLDERSDFAVVPDRQQLKDRTGVDIQVAAAIFSFANDWDLGAWVSMFIGFIAIHFQALKEE